MWNGKSIRPAGLLWKQNAYRKVKNYLLQEPRCEQGLEGVEVRREDGVSHGEV
jgi:hypothetical protein